MEPNKKNITNLIEKKLDPISFFEKNTDFVFIYKKTEKLASAVYMVTNLFSDNEPMKWTLRKKISDLVSFALTYKDIPQSSQMDFVYNLKTRVLEVVSLLEVSLRGGLVSHMNFSILQEEFSNLANISEVSNFNDKSLFYGAISKNFFDIQQKDLQLKETENPRSYHQQSDIKDKSLIKDTDTFKRSNRQNIILGLLKKKKELTIKDIAQVIKDCSEKTIQRELISFIKNGVLKRTGERRWSKYSLK